MASFTVQSLEDNLGFGSRVSGITSSLLEDADVRAELNQLFQDRGVIVFDGVEPTPEMQVAISTVFGPLKDHPVASVERADGGKLLGVIAISSGPHAGVVETGGKQLATWQPWHFDHAYNNELNRAGVLRSLSIAREGGRTAFADGVQIWRDMDPAIRRKAEGIEVLYDLDLRYNLQRFGLPQDFRIVRFHASQLEADYGVSPISVHPAVWTRPGGEKVFHMTPYGCRGIVGDRSDAAFDLLAGIWDEAMRVIQPYYHRWHETDMVLWDNWRVLHHATGCPPEEHRVVHRTTIRGDYGLGRWLEEPQGAA